MSVNVNISVCKDVSENEKREYIDRFMEIYRNIVGVIQKNINIYEYICRRHLYLMLEDLSYIIYMIDNIISSGCVWEPYTSSRISSIKDHVDERIREMKQYRCIEGWWNINVKVKVVTTRWIHTAEIYCEEAKKIYEYVKRLKDDIKKMFPYVDDVDIVISINELGSEISDTDLEKGIIAETSSWRIGGKTLDEFVNKIKSFLDKNKIEYEIEIE